MLLVWWPLRYAAQADSLLSFVSVVLTAKVSSGQHSDPSEGHSGFHPVLDSALVAESRLTHPIQTSEPPNFRMRVWVVLGLSVLALLAAIGTGFYGGWGPCGPATGEGMLLMAVGILGTLASGAVLIGKALLGLAQRAFERGADT